jgi:hypothetical protein
MAHFISAISEMLDWNHAVASAAPAASFKSRSGKLCPNRLLGLWSPSQRNRTPFLLSYSRLKPAPVQHSVPYW